TRNESVFENQKIILNDKRKDQKICQTKYPLLMVHGVFFRDFKYLNYWGRIPKELIQNGATIFYGNQQSAASAADCGRELAERIEQVLAETGAEKVNIIAHSKGGLDSRYAISQFGALEHVASLTTIGTPHRGCQFADHLLSKLPKRIARFVAKGYNKSLLKLGDKNPDFLAAVADLTAASCKKMNETVKDVPGVFYQSVGSKLNKSWGGRLPLNLSYPLVRHFDGSNDGLVSTDSFAWGEVKPILTVKGRRGISHGDMIDLFRENIPDFDVREFYVDLVHELKARGF
ncbi:MAG: alpha/beta fold hydrolase, partial [Eubacteriales bacterium]